MANNPRNWLDRLAIDLGDFVSTLTGRAPTRPAAEPVLPPAAPQLGKPEFLAAMRRAHGPPTAEAAKRLAEMTLYETAQDNWTPGNGERNNKIAHALIPKINTVLHDAYQFNPARVVITDAIRQDLCGVFYAYKRIVHVRKTLFQASFVRFFRTYIHEEAHCLQNDMMVRFDALGPRYFSDDEATMIRYWLAQAERGMSPERYAESGQEFHANWLAAELIPGEE